MKIDAIRNCRMAYSAPKKSSFHSLPQKNELPLHTIQRDTVSFKAGNTTKGATFGAVLGLIAIGALSAVSGCTLTPFACGAYAAAFGAAGGIAGKALDESDSGKSGIIA